MAAHTAERCILAIYACFRTSDYVSKALASHVVKVESQLDTEPPVVFANPSMSLKD